MTAYRGMRLSGKYRLWSTIGVLAASAALLAGSPALSRPASGPNGTVVHTALGGAILCYAVDQNGTEGILAEYLSLDGGKNNVALESFDQ